MNRTPFLATAAIAAAVSLGAATLSSAKSITLPPDGVQLKPSPLAGLPRRRASAWPAIRPNTCNTSRRPQRARTGMRWSSA